MIAIAAMTNSHVIGNNGDIPWMLPEDFKWFRKVTIDNILIMGRKTVDSLPKALESRSILTVSKDVGLKTRYDYVKVIKLIEENQNPKNPKKVILCGGSMVYAMLLPFCEELFLTRVKKEYRGDTFMPDFENYFTKELDISHNVHFDIEKWVNPHAKIWIKKTLDEHNH